jgi:transposase
MSSERQSLSEGKPCRDMSKSLPTSASMSWSSDTAKRLILSNGATRRLVWLLAQGKYVWEVAEVTGYCANWIRILARRYNQDGPEALADQRQPNLGAPALLTPSHQQQLQRELAQAPPDGGLWSGPKVAQWMSKQLGRKIHPQRGWEYLKRMGFSLQIPRPRHHKADLTKPRGIQARAA